MQTDEIKNNQPALQQANVKRMCRCCDEEWEASFFCESSAGVCQNCCSCAYGLTIPTDKGCIAIEPIKQTPAVTDDDLPF